MELSDIVDITCELLAVPTLRDDRPGWLRELPSANDDNSLYYRLLYEIGKRFAPLKMVEIGTYAGTSAAHLAMENTNGRVVTIDNNPEAIEKAKRLPVHAVHTSARIEMILGDSSFALNEVLLPEVRHTGEYYDLVFIDGLHTFNQTYVEYVGYRQLLKPGGIILFDDVALPMATNEMEIFWDHVIDPKVRVDAMHRTWDSQGKHIYAGFGACKTPGEPNATQPLHWAAIIDAATQRMKAAEKEYER